jgi:undecaprenyl-diphosphatase
MSTAGTGHKLPRKPSEAAQAARANARYGLAFLRARWQRLLLLFAGMLLPLWAFGSMADELREGEAFFFDEPLLRLAHDLASGGGDRVFAFLSAVGYLWGVVPADIALVGWLGLKRWMREGLFAGVSIGGSALLNLGAKQLFARDRPSLWESIAPENSYSFPSGHAMGSMTLACVLVLLAWHTRWRWWVVMPAATFVAGVGLSRIYLGVHYPSDILAGWAAASAWTVACYAVAFSGRRPWGAGTAPAA